MTTGMSGGTRVTRRDNQGRYGAARALRGHDSHGDESCSADAGLAPFHFFNDEKHRLVWPEDAPTAGELKEKRRTL